MNYSNTIVSGMLSWLRGIANWAINLFNLSGERSLSLLTWFSEHWVGMLITLIVLGLVIDWLVWIIRWRPYWVWFRRKRVLIDDTAERSNVGYSGEFWDGNEDRKRRKKRQTTRANEDLFSVASDDDIFSVQQESIDLDPNHFFSISPDDPEAQNLYQDDVFNVTNLQTNNNRKPRAKHN